MRATADCVPHYRSRRPVRQRRPLRSDLTTLDESSGPGHFRLAVRLSRRGEFSARWPTLFRSHQLRRSGMNDGDSAHDDDRLDVTVTRHDDLDDADDVWADWDDIGGEG